MQIKEYLLYYGLNRQEFADLVGVHLNTIHAILNARRKTMHYEIYQKIIQGTGGKVTLEDIMKEMQGILPVYPLDKDVKA